MNISLSVHLYIHIKIRLVWRGVQLRPLGTAATDWSIVACPGVLWWWRIWWNEDWQGKPKYSEKTFLSATLSTTDPTWPDPGSSPGRLGEKPATNRLSYGAARTYIYTLTSLPICLLSLSLFLSSSVSCLCIPLYYVCCATLILRRLQYSDGMNHYFMSQRVMTKCGVVAELCHVAASPHPYFPHSPIIEGLNHFWSVANETL
jgi:hypothetical protein